MSFMLSVAINPIMLGVIMLNVVMLSVVVPFPCHFCVERIIMQEPGPNIRKLFTAVIYECL